MSFRSKGLLGHKNLGQSLIRIQELGSGDDQVKEEGLGTVKLALSTTSSSSFKGPAPLMDNMPKVVILCAS